MFRNIGANRTDDVSDVSLGDTELGRALTWRRAGKQVALATVISTWGSSPRRTGSKLVICEDGQFFGSVSGGCIEGAVVEAAQQVLSEGVATVLNFGVSHERAWEVGLACGGSVEIYLERIE